MPKFKLTCNHFIEPDFLKAETIIDFQGSFKSLTPMMQPLDEEAQAMMDKYIAANPKATITPVDDLPRTMATVILPEPTVHEPIRAGRR